MSLQYVRTQGPPAALQSRYIAAPNPSEPPQLLGSGGFGSVYLYRDTKTGLSVAIKRIRLSGLTDTRSQELAGNIPQELRAQSAIRHPHVIRLHDVFLEGSHLNLVYEYADAGMFLQHVQQHLMRPCSTCNTAHTSEEDARRWFQQVVVTLDYLHAKGVSHRDIKLDNTLIKSVDGVPAPHHLVLKVADLGYSRRTSRAAAFTAHGPFTAPEVLSAHHAATRTIGYCKPYSVQAADAWSAGVFLHYMVAGQYPFARKLPFEERLQAMTRRPLQQLPTHLSQDCRDLLEALLQPNPAERITIQAIKQQPFFLQGLPPGAADMASKWLHMGSACLKTEEELEQIIQAVMQQLQPNVCLHPQARQ